MLYCSMLSLSAYRQGSLCVLATGHRRHCSSVGLCSHLLSLTSRPCLILTRQPPVVLPWSLPALPPVPAVLPRPLLMPLPQCLQRRSALLCHSPPLLLPSAHRCHASPQGSVALAAVSPCSLHHSPAVTCLPTDCTASVPSSSTETAQVVKVTV